MGIEVGVGTGILILRQNRVFVVVWKWLCSRLREGYWEGNVVLHHERYSLIARFLLCNDKKECTVFFLIFCCF